MDDTATTSSTTTNPSPPAQTPAAKPKRHPFRILLGLVVLGAIVAPAWHFSGNKVWTDGDPVRSPAAPAVVREVAWTPPRALVEVNTAEQQYEPSISSDGGELFFVRNKPGRNADIFV